jgi:acyl dehydratase
MIMLERPSDIAAWVGKEIGVSDWLQIRQPQITAFAELTGDDHWIHVDPERAARELPDGKTLVHGFLTVSYIPFLVRSVYQIRQRGMGLNYGTNKIRFTSPLQVDARIRMRQTIKAADPIAGGMRITSDVVIEVEGKDKPAAVVEFLMVVYDK